MWIHLLTLVNNKTFFNNIFIQNKNELDYFLTDYALFQLINYQQQNVLRISFISS